MGFWCLNCENATNNFNEETHTCNRCGSKNVVDVPGNITVGEMLSLEEVSKDHAFIQAMIDLRQSDPIEYQLKMSQFKANLSQQESIAKKTTNKVTCPYCQSTNTKKIDGTERIASVAMLGIFSKKINKSFKCRECGGTF